MVITSFDANYIRNNVVDEYISVVWTERYSEFGEFSIELPAYEGALDTFYLGEYLECDESDTVMLVLDRGKDDETNTVTFSGYSLEYILSERVVQDLSKFCKKDPDIPSITTDDIDLTYNVIKTMFKDNFMGVHPRKMGNITFVETLDQEILDFKVETTVSELSDRKFYNILKMFCDEGDFGFKIIVDTGMEEGFGLAFTLYNGYNRSRDSLNPVVVSYEYGNLISSNYFNSISDVKNAALVIGGQSSLSFMDSNALPQVKPDGIFYGIASGFERKEMVIDADDIVPAYTNYFDDNGALKPEVRGWLSSINKDREWLIENIAYSYEKKLEARAKRVLNSINYKPLKTLDGDIDPEYQFVLGKDYFLGDIIELENDYEIYKAVRISEVVISDDESGHSITPTFLALEDEKNEEGTE